ncbi:hypothetical protein JB92DRAFT_642792 [Gautieria morchelliformis]|nr:hypothetical protein JB92DRAFT_642792 [Gautieria morchelliformis]
MLLDGYRGLLRSTGWARLLWSSLRLLLHLGFLSYHMWGQAHPRTPQSCHPGGNSCTALPLPGLLILLCLNGLGFIFLLGIIVTSRMICICIIQSIPLWRLVTLLSFAVRLRFLKHLGFFLGRRRDN